MSRQAGSAPAQAGLIPIGWEAAGSVLHSLAVTQPLKEQTLHVPLFGQKLPDQSSPVPQGKS